MTISSLLSQSQLDFSVNAILKFHPQFVESPSNPETLFSSTTASLWTDPETNGRRPSAQVRRIRTPVRRGAARIGRRAEECWRSWSRGAVRRISGLRSQRMSSGLWERTSPRTTSWGSGPSRKVNYTNTFDHKENSTARGAPAFQSRWSKCLFRQIVHWIPAFWVNVKMRKMKIQ